MTPSLRDRTKDAASDRRPVVLILLAALFAVHPLIVHGCSCGHDFDFHLVNWMEAASQFSHGHLYPHWAFSPAYNAGEPRFVFYPPLSWVLGALLGLLLTHLPGVSPAAGWSGAPVLFTWIALSLSGVTMYRLARAFAGANAALPVAIFYLVNPYMLFTAFERTAYAELLAAVWIPLLLLSILRDEVSVPRVALPVALLWLTNAPAAVMGSYALALLATVRVVATLRTPGATGRQSALTIALKTASGTALGLGLAAFYVVPAAYERRFVQISMAMIEGMRIDHNFLFEHTGTSDDALLHDQVLHTVSWIAVGLLAAAAVALAVVFLRRRASRRDAPPFPLLPLTILAAGIAVLLTPLSLPLWNHVPEASFLQFPWRLLAVLSPLLALAIAVALGPFSRKYATAGACVLAAAFVIPAYHVFRQPCDPEDAAPARYAGFQSHAGTDPTDEYTPAAADNEALKANDPPYWLAPEPNGAAPSGAATASAPEDFSVTVDRPAFLILNLRDYPAWHVFRNGHLDPDREQRDDGLIALDLPAGISTIDIRYARTPDQTVGDAITLLALLILLWLMIGSRKRSPLRYR
jgi:hypothetical protein